MCCTGSFLLMILRPPGSTRTDTRFPYTTLCRTVRGLHDGHVRPWRKPGLAILHAAGDAGEAVAVAARAAIVAEVVAAAVPNRGDHVLFVERVLRVVGQGEAMARDQRADVAGAVEDFVPRFLDFHDPTRRFLAVRSEERRVGQEVVRTGRSRGA